MPINSLSRNDWSILEVVWAYTTEAHITQPHFTLAGCPRQQPQFCSPARQEQGSLPTYPTDKWATQRK